tara:strand:+ start:835 stop:1074 length:240 start_codon:yes stop_codon:yes gene_type:complete
MTLDLILTAVLWGCVIAMLISLHKLGTILDRMIERTSIIRLNISEIQDMVQTKIDEENREKAIDDFIDELNKKHNEEKK